MGENADFSNPRCLFHWLGAFLLFISTVIVMTALLITVGKSALIENLPFWVMYGLLFTVNYTDLMRNDRFRKNYRPKEKDAAAENSPVSLS